MARLCPWLASIAYLQVVQAQAPLDCISWFGPCHPSSGVSDLMERDVLTQPYPHGKLSPACLEELVPWCSGQTCGPVKAEIAGSNPVGTARNNAKEPIKKVGFFVV